MEEFIQNMPKAELHLHIEGTFEPELMFEIAQRNQISIPYASVEELKNAYKFSCLQDFLDIYYQGAQVLQHEKDFYDLTMAYLKKCKEQNIRHTEIMFDPQTHTERGIPFESVLTGIHNACLDAQKEFGISFVLIMSFLRHLSEEEAFKTLKQAEPFKDKIMAIGLDSSEKGNPPLKFVRVFQAAVEQGYIPLAHAGEEGDADYIWQAIDLLQVHRIDHGNNCITDRNLVEEIIERDLALTVCPLSNVALKVVPNIDKHPLKIMMQLGLYLTINSDDPAYFGGYINENFNAIQNSLDLSRWDLYTLAKNSFVYSLASFDEKSKYLEELDRYYEKYLD
ncbi:adenosine deaminase [Namhaeicola litoreus]|uniref:Adenine deaminase n=1 Tax=Namhaeicola litoreus TaxID=1052145 RepID=A0ABW3Y4Y8_9FLAO